MNEIMNHHTPDNEELDEQTRCFECGLIASPDGRGLAVAEGIVLCQTCCERRGGSYDHERATWTLKPWFDDLTRGGAHA
jgi:hypothetical protein